VATPEYALTLISFCLPYVLPLLIEGALDLSIVYSAFEMQRAQGPNQLGQGQGRNKLVGSI
jgi:hypothetical protein